MEFRLYGSGAVGKRAVQNGQSISKASGTWAFLPEEEWQLGFTESCREPRNKPLPVANHLLINLPVRNLLCSGRN
jgi:hypothetical protein